jgi:hypothetical protein
VTAEADAVERPAIEADTAPATTALENVRLSIIRNPCESATLVNSVHGDARGIVVARVFRIAVLPQAGDLAEWHRDLAPAVVLRVERSGSVQVSSLMGGRYGDGRGRRHRDCSPCPRTESPPRTASTGCLTPHYAPADYGIASRVEAPVPLSGEKRGDAVHVVHGAGPGLRRSTMAHRARPPEGHRLQPLSSMSARLL